MPRTIIFGRFSSLNRAPQKHLSYLSAITSAPLSNIHTLFSQPAPPPPAPNAVGTTSSSYSQPETYDMAFGFRDFQSETKFLLKVYTEITKERFPHTFLELGCGPARHGIALAMRHPCHVYGIDNSADMLRYAQGLVDSHKDSITKESIFHFIHSDMTSSNSTDYITDKEAAGPIDLACILLGTLSHCLSTETAIQCFENVCRVMRAGGVFVIEVSHPGDLFSGSFVSGEHVECWEQEDLQADKRVLVEYGREGDEFDPGSQILHRTVGLSVYQGDDLKSSEVDLVAQRLYTLGEIELLAQQTGFAVCKVYGDMDANVSLMDEEAHRMVVILKKL